MTQEQENYLFTDWPIHVVAIDHTGQFVALPGRGGLAIVDLTQPKPETCIHKISRLSKWDCNAVEWNPLETHRLASTSNTKVELWIWREGESGRTKEHSSMLRAHTRAVSDLNWSKFNASVLATCSYDNYIYIWDLRDSRKPKTRLSTVIGASQVKWNSTVSHILATSHDRDVRIWDLRKGNSPVSYISAHLSKISGLDWCPTSGRQLLTCSLDKTVKIWDVFTDLRNAMPMAVCDHRAPVWRAKYTPHGNSILTVPLSTASQRTINVPYLWNINNLKNPIQTLYRATSVLEFQWRSTCSTNDSSEYQLVTWSRDQVLKLWSLEPRFWQQPVSQEIREEQRSKSILHDPVLSPEPPEHGSSSGEDDGGDVCVTSERDSSLVFSGVAQPHNLEEEINYVRNLHQNLVFEEINIADQSCVVSVNSANNHYKIIISFPSLYPDQAMPSFEFTEDTPLDSPTKLRIIKSLREKAESYVTNGEACLEACLNSLISGLEELRVQETYNAQMAFTSLYSVSADTPFGFQDATIPFPRTTGATFCASGILVCFSRPSRYSSRKREVTPRSLSALSSYGSRTLSSFYNLEMLKTAMNKTSVGIRKALVTLRDTSSLMAYQRTLAQSYCILGDSAQDVCEKNMKSAMMVGRQDLVQAWSLLALIMDTKLTPSVSSSEPPWACHPFGRKLIKSLLDYYLKISDVQMLAMMSCILQYQSLPDEFTREHIATEVEAEQNTKKSYEELRTTPRNFNLLEEESPNYDETLSTKQSSFRTNSYSPSFTVINISSPIEDERGEHERNCRFINKDQNALFDHFKLCYADLLYKWQLINQRSEVLKFVIYPQNIHRQKDLVSDLFSEHFTGLYCISCKKSELRCVVCRLTVKGSSTFCLHCGHGGHTAHLLHWFETMEVCPTGCGCHCLSYGYLTGV